METFYIFGFGVISALVIVAVTYSVMVISGLKKKSEELEDLWEDAQEDYNNFQRDIDNRINNLERDINEKFTQIYLDLELIKSNLDSRFDKVENRIKEDFESRFEEIEDDIEEINRNSQIMRETL
jgi:chromosome segregation ATPase